MLSLFFNLFIHCDYDYESTVYKHAYAHMGHQTNCTVLYTVPLRRPVSSYIVRYGRFVSSPLIVTVYGNGIIKKRMLTQ